MQGARPEIEVMWWDPRTTDFETGAALTRGLGRLKHQCISGFLPHVNEIIARCTELRQTKPNLIISLFGELIQTMLELIEKLQNLPTTFPKMVFWVTSLQRAFLELDALYNYITVYKAGMTDYLSARQDPRCAIYWRVHHYSHDRPATPLCAGAVLLPEAFLGF
jgi:hypothetical protein